MPIRFRTDPYSATLLGALTNPRYPAGRSLETLRRLTGGVLDEQQLRDKLIDIGARGTRFSDGREGWTLRAPDEAVAQ